MKQRETLGSRLGFILLSAGCAIGVGNVWRFPYITGQYGGGIFVLIYVLFLMILGIPIMTMEYAMGRATKRSILPAYRMLEPKGSKWHIMGYLSMAGNYVLLMYYSVISGWIFYYALQMAKGTFSGLGTKEVGAIFSGMMSSPEILITSMLVVVISTAVICSMGLKKGVESVTKVMMIALLVLMVVLGIRSLMLPGAAEGISFYLMPNIANMQKAGLWNCMYAALNQSFFTLSIGMGGMEIFGSYIDKNKRLMGEAVTVTALDTFVAITAGLIIFPACFAYGIAPDAGPKLIFLTLPRVFSSMAGGRIWGTMFFIFLSFAALSTMIGVFENLQAFAIDLKGAARKKAGIINGIVIAICSVPCALGFNLWSWFQPLRPGNTVMDMEDFFVSNICLQVGSLIITIFCCWKYGWGFDHFIAEANEGDGIAVPRKFQWYFKYVLPVIVGFLVVYGIVTYF
ncbi:MAG: sodium-dependent transporter [Acidaminococcus sp.]|jgi:NSS family neurotransmitter:Na+ symporter|nr:sodium-dependent transporter [Acidaminococcus sp.]MCI2114414.1 sodium-dependent transporter [Acidaminococcus sp.]MCI2116197.1 sodium-dependent transporter [Acidaminococcus sp.]